jgi:hypothetical protein
MFYKSKSALKNGKKDEFQKHLKDKGISTMVYYSYPLDKMRVFKSCLYPRKPSWEVLNMKKITDEDFFMKNSDLSMEFSRYVLEHPEMDDILTEDKAVIFLLEFDPELKKFNEEMAKEIETEGGKVLYINYHRLRRW